MPYAAAISHPSPATISISTQLAKPSNDITALFSKLPLPSSQIPNKFRSIHFSRRQCRRGPIASILKPSPTEAVTQVPTPALTPFVSRFAPDEPRKGCDVLVEALEREGVTDVFAYPGGASMEIHQALTRSKTIRNVLPRHEQGGVFAAEGYARASGLPGVCIATSGPGATNLVSGLADALLDSTPVVAITGQVPRRMIGTDAFQETPIVEVTRSITKHNEEISDQKLIRIRN